MDEGLVQPRLDLDTVLGGVHEEMTLRARKRRSGVIPLGRMELIDWVSTRRCYPCNLAGQALDILDDRQWVQKTDDGFRVLTPAPTQNFFEKVSPNPGAAGREGGSLGAKRLDADDAYFQPVGEASAASRRGGGMERSVQNYRWPSGPRVELCRDYFPDLLESHQLETVPRHLYWPGLCHQVKKLESDYQVGVPFVRLMMEEFVRHPDWCQRSRRAAWQVFVSRRDELVRLVHRHRKMDPANRRHTPGAGYWLRRS